MIWDVTAWRMEIGWEAYLVVLLVLRQTRYSTAQVLRAKLVCAYEGFEGVPQHSFCQDLISTALQTKRSAALGVAGKSFSVGALVT